MKTKMLSNGHWLSLSNLRASFVVGLESKCEEYKTLRNNARELQCRIMKTKKIRKGHITKDFPLSHTPRYVKL